MQNAWCSEISGFALGLGKTFLILAIVVAVAETGVALWTKLSASRQAPPMATKALDAIDPVKLIEALKGLLEALKGLPAWIAIFLAGAGLFWLSMQKVDSCPSDMSSNSSQPEENRTGPVAPNALTANSQGR